MPVYEYRGLTAGNKTSRGMIDADSLRAARLKLRAQGIYPTELNEGKTRSSASKALASLKLPQLGRVSALDLNLFTNQLATLLAAGVPMVESLAALTEQVESRRLTTVVGQVRESVNHGTSLADSLGTHPQVFDDLYQAMVRAGESAGALEIVLTRLADYIEGQMELRNKVINAMVYPMILLGVSAVVVSVAMIFVIPRITGLLQGLNQELPLPTMILIACSDFFNTFWLPLVATIALALLLFNRLIQTERGRYAWDRFRLRMPVVGRVVRYVSISRFSRTLATLLSGGLPIITALEIAKQVTANVVIGDAVDDAKEAITQGATIAGPLRQSGQFPPMVIHMVSVGEASGDLGGMLGKVADTYDELVDNAIDRLTALMGPILLVGVAGVIVLILLSIVLPLTNLTASL